MWGAAEERVQGIGHPAMPVGGSKQLVDQSGNVLPSGNPGDRASKNVIEHQRRDAYLGQRGTKRFFHDAVHAAAHEHGAAFDVHRADAEREQHHSQHEPRRRLAHRLFRGRGRVKRRRAHVIEHDGGGAPPGNEGQHHRAGDDNADSIVGRNRLRRGRHRGKLLAPA